MFVMRSCMLGLALALLSAPSRAEQPLDGDKETCADAYDNGQVLRDAGKLAAARAQLEVCVATCPAALLGDCEKWLADVTRRLPTVVLRAPGESGSVRVTADGRALGELPAGELPLDPGRHELVLERASDGARVTLHAELREGEKGRELAALFPRNEPAPEPSGPPPLAIALGATGLAALLAGGILTIVGHAERQDLFDCKPNCAEGDVDAVRTEWTAAGIVAGAGAALVLGGGLAWAF